MNQFKQEALDVIERLSREQRDSIVVITGGGQATVSAVNILLKEGYHLKSVASMDDGTGRFRFALALG